MGLIPITKRVKFVAGENQARFPFCNCLLIDDEVRAIIDTGAGDTTLQLVNPPAVDMVIYSHYHYDHVSGFKLFPQAEVWAHPLDAVPMRSLKVFGYYCGFELWPALMGRQGTPPMVWEDKEFRMELGQQKFYYYYPLTVHQVFTDGHVFNLGETQIKAIHTPGHTAGHSAFYIEKDGILFSADIDANNWGPWYGNLHSDIDQYIDSIEKVIALQPKILLTCHEEPITQDIEERLRKYLNRIYERDERILNFLAEPKTLREIATQNYIYHQHRAEIFLFWEMLMAQKHLDHLIKAGQVNQLGDKFVAIR